MAPLHILRITGRTLLRRPLHAALVVGTLAVGVAGATAVFALVDGVLLDALPYEEPDRLVTVDVTSASSGFGISLSIPHYEDWRDRNRAFSLFGASAGWNHVRETVDGAERLSGRLVLGEFFGVLGLEPVEGRLLEPSETEPGAEPAVVLGHSFRARAFPTDEPVVGRTLTLDGVPHTVVGVLATGQGYPSPDVDVYLPMGARAASLPWDDRGSSFGTRVVARLAEGMTVRSAQGDMDRVVREVTAEIPEEAVVAEVRTVRDLLLGDVTRGLWILMAAVLLVLVIAGANIANLALARADGRAGELRVRRALGAGGGDITAVVLAETAWLSLIGGGLGVSLAHLAVAALPSVMPVEIPALVAGRIGVDGSVLTFALVVTMGAGAVFGLVPALHSSHRQTRIGTPGRSTGDRASRRFRESLVVGQVALSFVLLVAAGLLVRSLGALSAVEKGFDAQSVVTARLIAPSGTFAGREQWVAFHDGVLEALERMPDVERAAATLLMPLTGASWELRARSEAGPEEPDERPSVLFNIVSEGYFATLGVPLIAGRSFTPADAEGAPGVALIDESMAELFWPGEDPLGRRISIRDTPDGPEWRTVVGVAANTRHYALAEPSRPQVYVPMRQAGATSGVSLRVAAKVRGDPAAVVASLRSTVARLEPSVPVVTPRMLDEYVNDAMGATRSMGVVTTAFAVVAVLLAGLGVFGVLSLLVARRKRELGVRMAVGASPTEIWTLIAGQGMRVVALGAALGVVASLIGARTLQAFLHEVRPIDAGVYGAVLAVLLAATACAVAGPALRAASIAPGRVLREE